MAAQDNERILLDAQKKGIMKHKTKMILEPLPFARWWWKRSTIDFWYQHTFSKGEEGKDRTKVWYFSSLKIACTRDFFLSLKFARKKMKRLGFAWERVFGWMSDWRVCWYVGKTLREAFYMLRKKDTKDLAMLRIFFLMLSWANNNFFFCKIIFPKHFSKQFLEKQFSKINFNIGHHLSIANVIKAWVKWPYICPT